MAAKIFTHDPNAKLYYSYDWTSWLKGATVVSCTCTVVEGTNNIATNVEGVAANTISAIMNGSKAVIAVVAGNDGDQINLLWHVIASNGEEDDRTTKVAFKHL